MGVLVSAGERSVLIIIIVVVVVYTVCIVNLAGMIIDLEMSVFALVDKAWSGDGILYKYLSKILFKFINLPPFGC